MKTIFITGASSGLGKATAKLFQAYQKQLKKAMKSKEALKAKLLEYCQQAWQIYYLISR